MQDSLEDYLRISKNTKQDVSSKINKEMVVTAQLKKECDARAMKIVEFSIEGKLRPEVFTRCLPFINQSHYQDIVEERAITKLCGYSVCGKRIPDMPKKQYFISTKSNKVYDITERKNFCSNFCYKASLHIQKQVDNSPLWLRKLEDIPEYTFLHSSEGGIPGEYIDQGVVKATPEYSFTSINSFAGASLGDLLERELNPSKSKNNNTRGFKKPSRLQSTMQTIKENQIEEEIQVVSNEINKSIKGSEDRRSPKVVKKEIHHKKGCILSLPSIEENEEKVLDRLQGTKETETDLNKLEIKENIQENYQVAKHERTQEIKCELHDEKQKINENISIKTDINESSKEIIETRTNISVKTEEKSIKTEPPEKKDTGETEKITDNTEKSSTNKSKKQIKKKVSTSKSKAVDMESIIRQALDDWLTVETCIFIHGEQKVKQVLNEKKLSDYFEELNVLELQMDQQMKYMEICRRLQLQEMADEKFDNAVTGGRKLKPLPDYKKLKADTKDMTLKVKSFYEGSMYEQEDTNFPTQINKKPKEGDPEEGPPAVLPPVDVNSQKLLRRKIFLNSLNKAIQQLLQSLGVSYYSAVLLDIQALVKTFNLKANNIAFKPIVWSYIALVLLNLLSLKEDSIKEILEERRSQEYIQILFDTLPNKKNFVDDVLTNVKNIETFVEKYITKKDSNV